MLARFTYKLQDLIQPGIREKMKLAESMQWWTADAVKTWQWEKVKALLYHAWKYVPYYQLLFNTHGMDPDDIQSWDDFKEIPLLTKEIIQDNLDNLRTPGVWLNENHTGGSTGRPLIFYQDKEYLEWQAVSLSMGYKFTGFETGDKQTVLWGSDADAKWHESLKGRLWNWTHNIDFINMFDITGSELKRVAHDLHKQRPGYIWTYVSSVVLLADQIVKDGLHVKPKGVQTTAGTLYPSIREKLQNVFGNVIFDRYGCREVANIAHECSAHQGLHVFNFHNYLEVLQDGVSGMGKIVVTNLHNKGFPFIRYELGDLAQWSDDQCVCGRSFPSLKRIIGRTVEIITSPSGKLIDGEFFTHLFYNLQGIKQFQVVQESLTVLVIKIVKGENFRTRVLSQLESDIKTYGDPAFEIQYDFVDHIPPLKSGKMIFVLSKVPVKLQ